MALLSGNGFRTFNTTRGHPGVAEPTYVGWRLSNAPIRRLDDAIPDRISHPIL